jgi:Common central domain of tyrosinase/Polyphenol oxidase middle domain
MNNKRFDAFARTLARSHSRRTLLSTAARGALGGTGGVLLAAVPDRLEAVGCMRIRPNLHGLDPNGPELAAYAQGIQAMKTLGEFQPLSWLYQANIHGTFTSPVEPIWNTCEHGTLQFWPWHRLYLVEFEKIVRQASGFQAFSLPFWDYSKPDQRVLPAPFRDPASPLYVGARNPDINAGLPPVGLDSIFDHCNGFLETDFSLGSGSLEGTPHGNVHIWIEGWMGIFETAGQDPIFWLHHSNIDRLWESWLAQGGGRANPTDSSWLNFPMSFYDENGGLVTMTTSKVLDTSKLCYAYEYLATCGLSRFGGATLAQPVAPPQPPELIGESITEGAIVLGLDPVSVPIDLTVDESEISARTIVLNLEGVQGQDVLLVTYEIYVNLPEGTEPDFESIYYVGNINLFGLQLTRRVTPEHEQAEIANQRYNLTNNFTALQANDQWTGQLEVTFVPLILSSQGPGAGETAEATAAVEGPFVTIERITVTAE